MDDSGDEVYLTEGAATGIPDEEIEVLPCVSFDEALGFLALAYATREFNPPIGQMLAERALGLQVGPPQGQQDEGTLGFKESLEHKGVGTGTFKLLATELALGHMEVDSPFEQVNLNRFGIRAAAGKLSS